MKTKQKLIEEYFKSTGYESPQGIFKICPQTLIEHFYNWLKENKHIVDEEKESNKA